MLADLLKISLCFGRNHSSGQKKGGKTFDACNYEKWDIKPGTVLPTEWELQSLLHFLWVYKSSELSHTFFLSVNVSEKPSLMGDKSAA